MFILEWYENDINNTNKYRDDRCTMMKELVGETNRNYVIEKICHHSTL